MVGISSNRIVWLVVQCLLLLMVVEIRCDAEISASGPAVHLLQDPEHQDFNGIVDFSNAVPGPDGSWCITKVKYVDRLENDEVKECWHQNITQCHDTYITEFLPSQEQKCEETFWKSCKINFKEIPFNYTLKQCHTPLVKDCNQSPEPQQAQYGSPQVETKTVCRTWFESECNTTYVATPSGDHKPNTWCHKVPRKICAPDNCNMVQGDEECTDRVMISTVQKPEEHCQLQPQQHCRLITKLIPHLTTKEVCKDIPKEICVMKLKNPHMVQKPVQLKWCTKNPPNQGDLAAYAPPSGYLPAPASSQDKPDPILSRFTIPSGSNKLKREPNYNYPNEQVYNTVDEDFSAPTVEYQGDDLRYYVPDTTQRFTRNTKQSPPSNVPATQNPYEISREDQELIKLNEIQETKPKEKTPPVFNSFRPAQRFHTTSVTPATVAAAVTNNRLFSSPVTTPHSGHNNHPHSQQPHNQQRHNKGSILKLFNYSPIFKNAFVKSTAFL